MLGNSLAAQWLRLCASTAGVTGLIPGQGSKINAAAAAKSLHSCPTLQPHRRQPTRLPIPGILQARTLEWIRSMRLNQKKERNYFVCFSIDCLPCPPLSVSFMRAETFPQHLGQCLAQKWPVNI